MSDSVRNTFNTRITFVMESLLAAAVVEIVKIFEGSLSDSQMEIVRNRKEIDILTRRLESSEKMLKYVSKIRAAGISTEQSLHPSYPLLVSNVDPETTMTATGDGPKKNAHLLQEDALTPGNSSALKDSKQPSRVKDEMETEVTKLELAGFSQTEADVVSIIIKEELDEQDPESMKVEMRESEESSLGAHGFRRHLPAVSVISGEEAQEEAILSRRVNPQLVQNPAVSVNLPTSGIGCVPCRPRPAIPDYTSLEFNGLRRENRKQGGNETLSRPAQGNKDVIADKPPYAIRSGQVNNIQQRSIAVEPSKFHSVPGTMEEAVSSQYQPCLSSVHGISNVHRSVDRTDLQQYTSRQGKTAVLNLPQKQSSLFSTGERPYTCNLCLKGFISPSHLNMHMRVHTGERPYCCAQCGMRFAQKGNLRAHQRQVHQGKRPFPCPECGKRFTKRGNLRTHQQQVHLGRRPFSCTECGKGYFSQKDLKSHERVHTGQ